MNDKKFYAQINHSTKATTTGAIDIYTFLVLEFKNNKIYPSYLVIPSQERSIKTPVNYRFENKILYLAKPLDFNEDLGTVFTYTNGNLVSQKKRKEPEFVFKPSLDSYFKRNK